MAFINVAQWSPDDVNEWLKGLDYCILPYVHFFLNNNINGCRLLLLSSDDLQKLNVTKIGHQEIILDGVDLLKHLHYNFTSETFQTLALRLACKSRSLYNQLKQDEQTFRTSTLPGSTASSAMTGSGASAVLLNTIGGTCSTLSVSSTSISAGLGNSSTSVDRVTTKTLADVCDILSSVKSFVSWIDAFTLDGQDQYIPVRKVILTLSIELASTSQRDQFVEKPNEIIKKSCLTLANVCDRLVQDLNDSLTIQASSLEIITLKKRADEEIGIQVHSSYSGVHTIGGLKASSPAKRCGRLDEGDEIVQVNYQTVVGWQMKKLVEQMKECSTEVILTVKKKPRHNAILGQVTVYRPYQINNRKTATTARTHNINRLRNAATTTANLSQEKLNEIVSQSVDNNQVNADEIKKTFFPQVLRKQVRPRIRRRATITSLTASPTMVGMNAPAIRIEDLICSTAKVSVAKEAVHRSTSHDPSSLTHKQQLTVCLPEKSFSCSSPSSSSSSLPPENKSRVVFTNSNSNNSSNNNVIVSNNHISNSLQPLSKLKPVTHSQLTGIEKSSSSPQVPYAKVQPLPSHTSTTTTSGHHHPPPRLPCDPKRLQAKNTGEFNYSSNGSQYLITNEGTNAKREYYGSSSSFTEGDKPSMTNARLTAGPGRTSISNSNVSINSTNSLNSSSSCNSSQRHCCSDNHLMRSTEDLSSANHHHKPCKPQVPSKEGLNQKLRQFKASRNVSSCNKPPPFKLVTEVQKEVTDRPATPDTPRKPAMGVSMIGKHRISNVSADKAAIDAALTAYNETNNTSPNNASSTAATPVHSKSNSRSSSVSSSCSTNSGSMKYVKANASVGKLTPSPVTPTSTTSEDEYASLARIVDNLGTTLFEERANSSEYCSRQRQNDDQMCHLVLSLRALQRTFQSKDMQSETKAINELLDTPITLSRLKHWIRKYPHLF